MDNKSAILLHITYCDIAWHFRKLFEKKKIMERIEERALKATFKSKSQTYGELLRIARLPSLY